MKNFLFHNNRSTIKDELFLFLFIVVCIGVGLLCYMFSPSNGFIFNSSIKTFGILWIITGVMFIPGLIYRLFTNNSGTKK